MNYITHIFERANLQNVSGFLLRGVEKTEISNKTYKDRIDEASGPIVSQIHKNIKDSDEIEDMITNVFIYGSTLQDAYLEIGMRCGAMLMLELLNGSRE